MAELFDAPYDLLLGRKTYDIFAAYWPHAESGPDSQIAEQFNRVRKYVATHRPESLGWHQLLLSHDLIDEIRTIVFPIVLGKGKRLFGSGAVPGAFKRAGEVTTGSFA